MMRRWILDSRVGLRVLGLFVLAAATPVGLLAWLSRTAVDDTAARSDAALVANTAKWTSLQTLERLRLARQALLVDRAALGAPSGQGQAAALEAVLEIDDAGKPSVIHGTVEPMLLQALLAPAADHRPSRLHVVAAGARREVLLSAQGENGSLHLGLVDPAFLWDGADELPPGFWQCALDAQGTPLFCSTPAAAGRAMQRWREAREAPGAASAVALKGLFLGADFDAPDWYFVAGVDARRADAPGAAMRQVLTIAAAAALALAVLLALVQLRRTMRPLARLTAGARQIARRRFGVRLDIRSQDEFGELATAFNEMASRLQAQFDELSALAEIDREIVGQSELVDVHTRIVLQLQRALPGRMVAVAHRAAVGPAQHASVLLLAPGGALPERRHVALDAAACAQLQSDAEWMPFGALAELPGFGDTPGARALPLHWRDRCFGFIAIGPDPGAADELDEDTLRQVLELRNRAAIAAGAAEHEQTLRRAARHDSVTGLLNRHGLDEELRRLIGGTGNGRPLLALLFVDLDRFKHVNDSLGHAAGDQALRLAAERLRGCLPAGALAARPAGDEFVLLLPAAGGEQEATALAGAVCEALAQPMLLAETVFFLQASVGVALCSDPQTPPEQLLRSADQAMYVAKRRGGGSYAMFDPQLDVLAQRRAWIETELPLAAERGELRLHYQPRLDRAAGRMTSVEALIRWQHPQRGLCPPGEFIAIAEESELIEHLGRWIIDTACTQVRAWRDAGIGGLRIAINLSARQIASDRLPADLQAAITRHGIRPDDLELEITESLLVEQTEATVARLHALRAMGMSIALDDFGTGYSSMSYLRSLPIDVLKIDRAFVKDLGRDRSALAIAKAIVALASSLGMRTVAEGVETAAQWQVLAALRCDEVQGFLFSKPVEAQAIPALIARAPAWLAERDRAAQAEVVAI